MHHIFAALITDKPGQSGGRDTAGMGGRGGYMRLFKGHDIKQVGILCDHPPSIDDSLSMFLSGIRRTEEGCPRRD